MRHLKGRRDGLIAEGLLLAAALAAMVMLFDSTRQPVRPSVNEVTLPLVGAPSPSPSPVQLTQWLTPLRGAE